jgi:hypothetical protein
MPKFLPFLLVFGVSLTVGCDSPQPANAPAAKADTDSHTSPQKPSSDNSDMTTTQRGVRVPPVIQQPTEPVQSVAQPPKIELGDSEQRPVLFFDLHTGMIVRVSNLKYDSFGWVDSYEAVLQQAKGGEAKMLVLTETPAGGGKAPTHAATFNGKPVSRQSDKKLAGFSVKDTGGVVLARSSGTGQTLKTTFSYDPTGRQDVGQQDFQHEGKSYTITYSDYRRDTLGRLEGYTARVEKAE